MLWVDTHRPKTFGELDVHPDLTEKLSAMVKSGDFPHLLFHGPSGSGKKTRVMALLREHYGMGAGKVRMEQRSIKTPSKSIDVTVLVSNFHIEVNPSDAGVYDRQVVMTLIKEIAESAPLADASGKRTFKAIVLNEVDQLSKAAQQALRRTMEKFMTTCRLILVCTSISRIIPPVRSRCLALRVPLPDPATVQGVLISTAKKEGVALPPQLASTMCEKADCSLRRALLMLEATKIQRSPLAETTEPILPTWMRFISEIAMEIMQEQSQKKIWEVRAKLYELLTNCIPPDVILQTLVECLLKNLDTHIQVQLVSIAAHYEHQLRMGSKPIIHLEAFVCQFMALYKAYLLRLSMGSSTR